MSREDISAFADGEMTVEPVGAMPDAYSKVVSALATAEGQASWDLYHRIGDTLRSTDLASNVSAGFSARMAKRLAQEPPLNMAPRRPALDPSSTRPPLTFAQATGSAPAPVFPVLCEEQRPGVRRSGLRMTVSASVVGTALAAVAAAAFIATPQFATMHGQRATAVAQRAAEPAVAVSQPATMYLPRRNLALVEVPEEATDTFAVRGVSRRASAAPALSDAELGGYIAAHQDLSPSLYRAANFARQATPPDTAGK
ncbi:MAG TPA: RseA family anti-sigma factor [Burkholderiaceae bacterium]